MRLLAGYTTASTDFSLVGTQRQIIQVAAADFLDAVAFEVVPVSAVVTTAQFSSDLMRARNAIQLYVSVARINEQTMPRLNVMG